MPVSLWPEVAAETGYDEEEDHAGPFGGVFQGRPLSRWVALGAVFFPKLTFEYHFPQIFDFGIPPPPALRGTPRHPAPT
jgi:hypothetical protein